MHIKYIFETKSEKNKSRTGHESIELLKDKETISESDKLEILNNVIKFYIAAVQKILVAKVVL